MTAPAVHVSPDAAAAADAVARAIVAAAKASIEARGRFTIALSGGSTPRPAYELLATTYAREVDWARTHVFFADERCVARDHADSNHRMVAESLLARVPIPAAQVHAMYESGAPLEAAVEYETLLRRELAPDESLDLVVLGVGADGHTASLFPGAPALEARDRWVVNAEAPPDFPVRDRITLTIPAIAAARRVLFLVTGESKREVVSRALAGDAMIPAAHVRGRDGTDWYLDQAAAP